MGVTVRVFFIDDKDQVRRIPLKRFYRLVLSHDTSETFPEYAGQRIRYVSVTLEVEGREPLAVGRVDYDFLQFDGEGRRDQAERMRKLQLAVDMICLPEPNSGGPVIDARRQFNQRRYAHEFRWQPTPEIEAAIVQAIFGKKDRPLRLV